MNIIGTIIIGFIAGVIAKFLHPGKENMGLLVTTGLGIAGSFVANLLGRAVGLYRGDDAAGLIASVIGAIILLVIYGAVKKRRHAAV